MKRKLLSILLSVCILTAPIVLTSCDGDSVRKTREAAERLVIYSDLSINSIAELKTQGALVGFEEAEAAATQALVEIRDATKVFVEKAMTFTKFDAASRADLAKLFVAVTDALQKLKPKVLLIATRVIEELNRRGITNIQEPKKIVSRINLALNFLDTSARLIQSRIAP
jgi:hypothetical protein